MGDSRLNWSLFSLHVFGFRHSSLEVKIEGCCLIRDPSFGIFLQLLEIVFQLFISFIENLQQVFRFSNSCSPITKDASS